MNEKLYEVMLTENEVNLVLTGLGQLPFIQVYEIINKIKEQVQGQMKEVAEIPFPDTVE